MLKKFFGGALLALMAVSLPSCSDDDDEPVIDPDRPTVSEGAFVLNQGNLYYKIEGSLSYLDYATGRASQNLYQDANNGMSIGNTPQDAIVYGSKIYLAVFESNVITVVDGKSFKAVKQISLADNEGQEPRSLVARDGKIYISMYNGYVSRLDTLSLVIDANVKVGPNPEIMALRGDNLYVPNSDGMNWQVGYGTTASVIDIRTMTVTRTFTVPLNPCQFVAEGNSLFLLAKGNYDDVPSKVYRINDDDSATEIAEATHMAAHDGKLYIANAPWGTMGEAANYRIYNIASGTFAPMLADNGSCVDAIVNLAVDPVTGRIIITSYNLDGGYISTSLDGYAVEYDANGTFLNRYGVGVGPACIFFNVKG